MEMDEYLITLGFILFKAVIHWININSDHNYTSLTCEEAVKYGKDMGKYVVFGWNIEASDLVCGMNSMNQPEWFRAMDNNSDGLIQLEEFDQDLAVTPNAAQLIDTLLKQNGLLTINLGDI